MEHTPGPWKADYMDYGDELWFGGSGHGLWSIGPADNNFVYLGGDAQVEGGKETMEADARLIAAAPELLEACKAVLIAVDMPDGNIAGVYTTCLREAHELATAAIAKATKGAS